MPKEFIAGRCFVLFNPKELGEKRTFCVLGSPRGGTSMASGLLRMLGVSMGENLDPDNNEDQDFIALAGGKRNLLRQLDPSPEMNFIGATVARLQARLEKREFQKKKIAVLGKIRELIKARNRAHSVWGWKDPISIFYVPEIAKELVEPVYLVVYRDALSVTLGEYFKNEAEPLVALNLTAETYLRLTRFIFKTNAPVLCISYEKALQNGEELITQLVKLTGTTLDDAERERLIAYIQPNRGTGRIES